MNIHPKVIKKIKQAAPANVLHNLSYRSGPIISLMNANGFAISKLNLPVGSAKGGKLLGASLPNPLLFLLASSFGSNSNDRHTYP